MSDMETMATSFLEQCETGQGWSACAPYCAADATFASQAEPIADIVTLSAYADWMQGLIAMLPDGAYEVEALAVDASRHTVLVQAVFTGTHTGADGPVPATGKAARSDYVYVMQFNGGRIVHLTKVWNAGWAMRQLGWV